MIAAMESRRRGAPGWVLAGGLLAGSLDIAYACAFWWVKSSVPPPRIFQSVAAGLLGDASFRGGAATAALGLALHLAIATTMAVAYAIAAARWPLLVRRSWASGILYGLLLYAVMNYGVVPLSAAGPGSRDPLWVGLSIAVHALLIGLPIALAVRRSHQSSGRSS